MATLDAVEITEPFEIQEFPVNGIARIEQNDDGLLEVTFFRKKHGGRLANVTLVAGPGSIPPILIELAKAIGCDMVATCPAIRKAH